MSTYLAAWAIVPDNFGFKEWETKNGKPVLNRFYKFKNKKTKNFLKLNR
jgi:hypothetical protein